MFHSLWCNDMMSLLQVFTLSWHRTVEKQACLVHSWLLMENHYRTCERWWTDRQYLCKGSMEVTPINIFRYTGQHMATCVFVYIHLESLRSILRLHFWCCVSHSMLTFSHNPLLTSYSENGYSNQSLKKVNYFLFDDAISSFIIQPSMSSWYSLNLKARASILPSPFQYGEQIRITIRITSFPLNTVLLFLIWNGSLICTLALGL